MNTPLADSGRAPLSLATFGLASLGMAACLLSAGAAFASDDAESSGDGFYIGARGGAIFAESASDTDRTEDVAGVPTVVFSDVVDGDYDPGFVVSTMAGYEFRKATPGITLRPEIELGYLSASLNALDDGVPPFDASGDLSVLFGFANAFADIEVARNVDLIVGGGVGVGAVTVDTFATDGFVVADTTEPAFGYNVGAGLGVEVAEGVKLEAMYRYMSFLGVEDRQVDNSTGAPVTFNTKSDLDVHSATVGLRLAF